jgi:hypothetical protein
MPGQAPVIHPVLPHGQHLLLQPDAQRSSSYRGSPPNNPSTRKE